MKNSYTLALLGSRSILMALSRAVSRWLSLYTGLSWTHNVMNHELQNEEHSIRGAVNSELYHRSWIKTTLFPNHHRDCISRGAERCIIGDQWHYVLRLILVFYRPTRLAKIWYRQLSAAAFLFSVRWWLECRGYVVLKLFDASPSHTGKQGMCQNATGKKITPFSVLFFQHQQQIPSLGLVISRIVAFMCASPLICCTCLIYVRSVSWWPRQWEDRIIYITSYKIVSAIQ